VSAASTSPDVPVAVTDSSVLVPVWSRYVLQRLAAGPAPPYRPVWSEWIIAETWRVLTEQWFERFGRHIYGGVEYVTAIEFIEDVLGMDAAALYERPLPGGAQLRSRRARR
jgi:hypothetical protein